MSIRFAGSRTVHERRRRRLAQESDVAAAADARRAGSADSDPSEDRKSSAGSFEQSPLHSLIRPQIWVHWCVVALCVGCWSGMLYVGDLAEQTDLGLKSILGIRSGRLANFFSTIMLLWAGQLALLIYWYRRKSPNDFHGRYRLWLWIGVTLQFFLAVVATEAHLPFGDYMQRMWPMNVPQYALLSWLVPVATISLAMFNLLRMETQNSTCSRVLLWIAGISGLLAGASLVVGSVLSDRACDLVQVGSATLAHLGLATALLFHARYVIHVSNEAPKPARKESAFRKMRSSAAALLSWNALGLRLPRLKLPKRKERQTSEPKQKTSRRTVAKSKSRSKPAPPPERASAAKSESPQAVQSVKDSSAGEASQQKLRIDEAEALKGPKRRIANRPSNRSEPVDSQDDASLEGLSKKERRRLRKKQRSSNGDAASAR